MSSPQKCIQPCRCQYVQRWLDVHEKYFPEPSKASHMASNVACAYRTNESHVNYSYRGNVVTSKVVQIPYVLHAPHRISPVNPLRK